MKKRWRLAVAVLLGVCCTACGGIESQEEAVGTKAGATEQAEDATADEPDNDPADEPETAQDPEDEEALEPVMAEAESTEEEPWELRYVDAWDEWHTTTIHPEWKQNSYDWSCLTNDDSGISYEGDPNYELRRGIDVSYHQGTIDWQAVKNAGYDFAFLRIAYRGYGQKGALCTDSAFHDYIRGAQTAGLDVGVYVFSQAINETEALEEADLVLENLKGYDLQLPVVFDPEFIRDDVARTDDVSGEQFTENTLAFCERIAEAGYEPMIYSNMIWEADIFDLSRLQQYPIWYADYEPVPQTPYAFEFWQYEDQGHVDGIQGVVDLDVWFLQKEE